MFACVWCSSVPTTTHALDDGLARLLSKDERHTLTVTERKSYGELIKMNAELHASAQGGVARLDGTRFTSRRSTQT